jgi:putative ABC transport system permease protein
MTRRSASRLLDLGGLSRRQLAADTGPASVLALMVLLVAAIFTAAPASMSAIATSEIRHSVTAVSPNDRNLEVRADAAPPDGPVPTGTSSDLPEDAGPQWGGFAAQLAAVRSRFPTQVQDATGAARFVLSTDAIELEPLPADTAIMQVAINADPYLASHLQLAAGHWPVPPATATGTEAVQVVLAEAAAGRMGWQVGISRQIFTTDAPVTLTLVGLVRANPADPDYPRIRPSSTTPAIFDDGNAPVRVTGSVYVATPVWPRVAALGQISTVVWFPIIVDAVDDRNVVALAADLRRVTAVDYPLAGPDADTGDVDLTTLQVLRWQSDLPATLDAAHARVVSAAAVQTVAALGPCGAALAVLALALRSFLRRREQAGTLLLTRGASRTQLRRSMMTQGLLIGVPTAVAAVLAVAVLFGRTVPMWAAAAGVLAGLIPALALPAGVARHRPGGVRTDLGTPAPHRVRRLAEAAVLVLAALSLYLLLSGGLTAGSGGGTDVLVAAAPIVLTLAVCVLVIRLYPLPLTVIGRVLRRRRGVVGYLGTVRSVRDPLVGVPLILATVTGVAVAVFSVLMLSTISTGIDRAAARTVGADLSVSGGFMTADVVAAARKVPGVQQVTPVGFLGTVSVSSPRGTQKLTTYFLDSSTAAEVQRDVPGAPSVPPGMADPGPAGVRVVVPDALRGSMSGQLTAGNGTPLELVGGGRLPVGFGSQDNWMLVDVAQAGKLVNTAVVPARMLIAERPGADAAAVDAALTKIVGPNIVLQRPSAQTAQLRAAPTIGGMRLSLIAATALGVLLVALAVAVTAVSGTRARNRLLSVLRLLGFNHRQVTQLAAWEQAPPAVTAVLVGGGFGVGLAALIRGVVDLRAFTGGTVQPEMAVQPWGMVAVIGGFLLVIAIAIGVSATLARRASAAVLMRTEE